MQSFSFKCKGLTIDNAMELVKTMDKGMQLFNKGKVDIDWYCQFLALMHRAGERLGVSFKFGNPKIGGQIL